MRNSNGRPITRRRYDYLLQRLGNTHPWVAAQQISIHWIRHTDKITISDDGVAEAAFDPGEVVRRR